MFIALSACKQTPRSKSYTIAVSQPTTTDAWRKAMMLEMERALTFHPNVHIIITDAQDNNEKQTYHRIDDYYGVFCCGSIQPE